MWGSRDPLLELWDPYISGMNKARNFKFGTEMDGGECKIRSKGIMWGSRDPPLELRDPNISGSNKTRNFKFHTEMDDSKY